VNALGITKTVMNRSFESTRQSVYAQEASGFALCSESAFHKEAVRRFLAKEPPLYQWADKA
jgi:enoyl-CoA hydratase/carnithine racemase